MAGCRRPTAQLDQLASAAREVYSDVREGIVGLRLAANPDLDFGAALATFVEKWESETGIDATFAAEGAPILNPGAELQLLRMTQEALANARKHSRASRVEVSLRQLPSGLELRIADDGAGFDPDRSGARRVPALRAAHHPRAGGEHRGESRAPDRPWPRDPMDL